MKIYITEPDAMDVGVIKKLLSKTDSIILGNTTFTVGDANKCEAAIIRSSTTITSSVKEYIPNLKHIIRIGTGLDNIDMTFCNRERICVYNSPGANADAVSDYVICTMLMALRKTHLLTKQDIESWNRFKFVGHTVSSRTIGIVGFGNIGKQIYHKLQSFGCRNFLVYDPFVTESDLPKDITFAPSVEFLLERSNVITLHIPLLDDTKYLINRDNINLISNGSVLINASRGGIVNEAALIHAIRDKDIVYIADTVENEPDVSSALLKSRNVIVTPHIASLTDESETAMIAVALKNFLEGNPVNKPTGTI